MNTVITAENPPFENEEQIKAEIHRSKAEMEQDMAAIAESQRRIDSLGAATQATLDRIKERINRNYPSANIFA